MTVVLDLHIVCVTVLTSSPAAEVHGTLVEQLAIGGREEVGGEDDECVGPY